jgi:hypothetical protein
MKCLIASTNSPRSRGLASTSHIVIWNTVKKIVVVFLVVLGITLAGTKEIMAQISRGATANEIYVKCKMYMSEITGIQYFGLLRSIDNGEHLSIQYNFGSNASSPCRADAYPGVVYNIRSLEFDKSLNYGLTWSSFSKPKGYDVATGNLPGELYVTVGSLPEPDLFRSADLGSNWTLVTPNFALTNWLLDVGSAAGELYAMT